MDSVSGVLLEKGKTLAEKQARIDELTKQRRELDTELELLRKKLKVAESEVEKTKQQLEREK